LTWDQWCCGLERECDPISSSPPFSKDQVSSRRINFFFNNLIPFFLTKRVDMTFLPFQILRSRCQIYSSEILGVTWRIFSTQCNAGTIWLGCSLISQATVKTQRVQYAPKLLPPNNEPRGGFTTVHEFASSLPFYCFQETRAWTTHMIPNLTLISILFR